jgi:cytochrome b
MNTTSAFRADPAAVAPPTARVLVWDAPVRIFHWLMVLCFAGAWISAESERWRLLHATLGYTIAGLIAFRVVWGVVGTKHARFANFVRAPAAVLRYLNSLVRGQPEHHAGHNPAGALAIVGLLGVAAVVVLSGWATYNDVAKHWFEELHEGAAGVFMALVVLHLAGVVVSSWLHRENLVAAMVTGRKPGTPADAVKRAWRGVAMLMVAAVLAFWASAWQAPTSGALAGGERYVPSVHARPAR